jgi:hypothetical protein
MLRREKSPFLMRTAQNKRVHSVGRTQSFTVVKQGVHTVTAGLQMVKLWWQQLVWGEFAVDNATLRRFFTFHFPVEFIYWLSLFWNKKFWEEPIAYFPLYDTDHTENERNRGVHRQTDGPLASNYWGDTQTARWFHNIQKYGGGGTLTYRQQGDLISLLTKLRGDTQRDGRTQTDTQTNSKVIS